jgi:hypothetical protein
MTDADRRRILREARELLERRPEYEPPPEPVRRRVYDPGPAELPTPPRRLDTPPPDFEAWLQERLAAERQVMLRAIVRIVGRSLGESVAAERAAWEGKLRELRLECAKLSSTLDSLHDVISAERSKVLELPALPRRAGLN